MTDYLRLVRESAETGRVASSPTKPPVHDRDKSDVSDRSPSEASPVVQVMDVTERLAALPAPSGSALEALKGMLASDPRMRGQFVAVCMDGAAALRGETLTFRAALARRGFAFEDYRREHEETAGALYKLAGSLLPGSPTAALARLKKRVRGLQEERTAREAVEELAAREHEWFDELVLLSARPPDQRRLRAASQQLWNEIRYRGWRYEPKGFTDHVWTVVRDLFPGSPGAMWDSDWADGIASEVRRAFGDRLQETGPGLGAADVPGLDAALAEMRTFEEAADRSGFRSAARRAVREARRHVRDAS